MATPFYSVELHIHACITNLQTKVLIFQKWPEADFHIVQDAGHSAKEPGIASLLVQACDKYKTL